MFEVVPNARLVLLVRQPMDRLWSHYLMGRMNAYIPPLSFAEFAKDPWFAIYRGYSDYGTQLKTILDFYPRESVLVLESKALDHDRDETLTRVFEFLGIDPTFRSPSFERRLNESKRRRFPTATGYQILQSRWMEIARRRLPFTVQESLRNLVLLPFSEAVPSKELPPAVKQPLLEHYRREVDLARQLSGLPLPSLDVESGPGEIAPNNNPKRQAGSGPSTPVIVDGSQPAFPCRNMNAARTTRKTFSRGGSCSNGNKVSQYVNTQCQALA